VSVFPYLLETGFEAGATGFDTAITDTQSKSLGYLHYSESAKTYGVTPFRGAYCWGVDLSVGTKTTAVYQTQAAYNVTADNYFSFGFAVYISSNLVMAANDRFTIAAGMASSTEEVVVDILYTAARGYDIVLDETNGGTPAVYTQFALDKWHWVEVAGHCDDGGTNNGTATLYFDGYNIGSLSSLDQGAFTDLYIGAINQDLTTTAGYVFFDDCIGSGIDTSAVRVGYRSRYPINPHISASQHLFVGPGTVDNIQLLTGTANDMLRLYDTDRANTDGTYQHVAEIMVEGTTYSTTADKDGPFYFQRGCYAVISGTNPRAQAAISMNNLERPTIYYGNDAALKNYALKRKERPGNR